MAAVAIRGTTYPVVLPKLKDPRLHLAATIMSLQVLGQVAFHFQLSITQILLCLVTCGVIEFAITFRQQHAIMWPASALLTGNGVAFVLRVPGTAHGDWWSFNGWWIFVATSAFSLLSKYLIKWRGEHVFNPSNIGLVVCFLVLGRTRAEPLAFWWGPMSWWMVLALAIIVTGGFAILSRLELLRVALSFWAAFAIGIAGVALAGHVMTARWHLGPISGFSFWWVLVTSPEVLVFLFFMITDPKTAPRGPRERIAYGIVLGALATVLIAPTTTEYAAKVALLSSLAIVCLAMAALKTFPVGTTRYRLAAAGAAGLGIYAAVALLSSSTATTPAAPPLAPGKLPPIRILPSPGVQTQLDLPTAQRIAQTVVSVRPASATDTLKLHLVPGSDQSPPTAVAQYGGATYDLKLQATGAWTLVSLPKERPTVAPRTTSELAGERLTNIAPAVGLNFRQGSFRYGISNDYTAMMGGGLCFLDYNGDGWQDLFVVNSYSSADTDRWQAHGGLPTTQLYENVHGTFRNVTAQTHAGLAVQGDGCAAADLNGDGRPDLIVTTTTGVDVLWNSGHGTFTERALPAHGWYTGVAVADVNGDGRPDVFVAGYSDPNDPVPNSLAGFPTNLAGVRDLLFLNEGGGRFREVGVAAGLESSAFSHGLGATFVDVNHDGRPDLYVANDEDPNELYENVPWPGGAKADPAGLGFRFEQVAAREGVADPYAGMGVATLGDTLFVTNSRNEPSAAYRQVGRTFANARPSFDPALGDGFAGWGASWVDLTNSGTPDLVLTAGAIPVTNLKSDAEQVRVLAPTGKGAEYGDADKILGPGGLALNGRGLAAADVDNDGRMEIAINTIGGKLALLRATGPSGHWLDVKLATFSPGAVVTATLPDGAKLSRTVQAGSSYLSSEDPRVHFGLGSWTHVSKLTVRYPWNAGTSTLTDVTGDRVVTVPAPAPKATRSLAANVATLPGCTPARHLGSLATYWVRAAIAVLRTGQASQPVQARDLYDLTVAMNDASPSPTAVSYAAYRLLVWRASYLSNLPQTFALLETRLKALCLSPAYTGLAGAARAEIAAGLKDGSNESSRYADPTYAPQNGPLVVSQAGSTVHDPTFWQPLALGVKATPGGGSVPTEVQTFTDAQWGGVGTFAGRVKASAPPFGDPTSAAYESAAIAVLHATSGQGRIAPVDATPLAWEARAAAVAPGSLAADLRLYTRLNGALNDAAVSAWGAKRAYQGPRPISMIRYLAFNDELPLVPGLVRRSGATEQVLSGGRWVSGAGWTPPVATPASPGWVSEGAAFAYAASTVLGKLTGHAFAAAAARAAQAGVAEGIQTPADVTAGRALGTKVGRLALAAR